METTHHGAHEASGHSHADEHAHEHGHEHGPAEDWSSEEYVSHWLERQQDREEERRRQFVRIRALIPKTPEQEFRYLNLGAGPGNLDQVLLERFKGAQATLVDGSLTMLGEARKRLNGFGHRVEYVQANLSSSGWAGAVSGPFDLVVSTIAIHNLRDPRRIRELYAEAYGLMGHGGMLINLDYIRPVRASLGALAPWAARDPEAGFSGRGGDGAGLPGTLLEQLGWLSEAGFGTVDVFWKDLSTALICGIRDHIHLPEGDGHGAEGHSHAH